jgi:hypothetical protein
MDKIVDSLTNLTKSAQFIKQKDISLLNSIPEIHLALKESSVELFQLLDVLYEQASDNEEKWTIGDLLDNFQPIQETLDNLLEKTDVLLSGKPSVPQLLVEDVQQERQSKTKPQQHFLEPVDNSRTPFVPRLTAKPNAIKPLEIVPSNLQAHLEQSGVDFKYHC